MALTRLSFRRISTRCRMSFSTTSSASGSTHSHERRSRLGGVRLLPLRNDRARRSSERTERSRSSSIRKKRTSRRPRSLTAKRRVPRRSTDRTEAANVAINRAAPGGGSFVAFYACQPFQSAVERTLAAGRQRQNRREDVFSYCLIEALRSQDETQSYRQLARSVTTLMGVFGGASRGQTPVIQGDIDASVFGDPKWPAASPIVLHARDGALFR